MKPGPTICFCIALIFSYTVGVAVVSQQFSGSGLFSQWHSTLVLLLFSQRRGFRPWYFLSSFLALVFSQQLFDPGVLSGAGPWYFCSSSSALVFWGSYFIRGRVFRIAVHPCPLILTVIHIDINANFDSDADPGLVLGLQDNRHCSP